MSSRTPFYSYSDYLARIFGDKTYKIVVSSGLTCPTRDGSMPWLADKKGCAFCDIRGSSSFHGKKGRGAGISEQIRARMEPIRARFNARHFLAYFQSYTNTYSADSRDGTYDTTYLRSIYEEALAQPGISGLCIGTRPDCLPDEVIDLLEELARKTYLSLELGVQSFEDPTLEWLTRGHDGACSLDAFERLRTRAPHVHTCAHLIFGSPTDSPTAGRDAALLLNQSGVKGAKLHQLMVLEHTDLATRYRAQPFKTLTLEEYAAVAAQFLEHLDPSIYVERLYATATHPDECLAPDWSRNRWDTHNRLRRLLDGTRQGARFPFAAGPS